jgi:diguanylate cyclase (GGDEF)-like protein
VLPQEKLAAMSGPMITLVVGVLYLALGAVVLWTGDPSETAAGFWPPAGVSLVAMLVLPIRRWGWVVLGLVLPTLLGVALQLAPLTPALWWMAGNCVEPAVAALVLLGFESSRWITRGRMLVVFLATAVVLAPTIGGAIGSIGTAVGYGKPWSEAWVEWIVADGLGVLVVVPLLVTYTTRGLIHRSRGEIVALAALFVTTTGLAFVDFGHDGTSFLPYLILVLLIWAGMRFGSRVAAAAGFVVGIGANVATSLGYGPFYDPDGDAHVVTLQIFLAIALVTSFVVAAMASDLADRDEVNRLLTHHATHDFLTGLPNRVFFADRLHVALQSREAAGPTVGVLLVDLDDFKKINDRHGHPTGDEVLTVVADALRDSVRPTHLLARLGGDEFVVLCDDLAGPDDALAIATEMSRRLDRPIDLLGVQHQLACSIGIAMVQGEESVTSTDLLRRADIALDQSKRADDVRVSLFDAALEARTRRRLELDEELRGAIERGELFVKYQPIVSLATGLVTGFEALLRWKSRRFGMVGPDEFIPIAETTGLISVLGEWVLETACRQAAVWRVKCPAGTKGSAAANVAVNVSARQVCDSAFPDRVRRILDEASLPAGALTLEITETAVMDDLDASELVLSELRQLGVRLSMDDFGTGYSSMTYLRRIPVNTLKIDRSFVSGLGNIREDTAIVESIINLARSFDVDVVAEGIETTGQLQHLIESGCDHGQGFLWSEAVDAESAAMLMQTRFDLGATTPASTPSSRRPFVALP